MTPTLFAEFWEDWMRVTCPNCNARNWVYFSHNQRAYPDVPNQCKCFGCQGTFWLIDKEESAYEESMQNCADGREIP